MTDLQKKISARAMALEILYLVDHEEAYSNLALNSVLEKYRPEKQDRGFVTELVYGVLRTRNTLDWVLGRFLKKPIAGLTPWIRNILRAGVYQLMYLDKVPESAAVNESVNLAKRYGHKGTVGLVNGVLRNVARSLREISFPDPEKDPVQHIAVKYSHPAWLVERWLGEYGFAETVELCRANNDIPPNAVRTNTLRTSREDLKKRLEEEGLRVTEGRLAPETLVLEGFKSVGSIAAHREGLFLVQDESSTLVGHALKPAPGSMVIDACSAPGGKTTHLAQLMANSGRIVACDIHQHKLELVRENAGRLGITVIEPLLLDAAKLHAKFAGQADYILVDAPCSGLGVLRRRPEIRWRKQPGQIMELRELQLAILESAVQCLKPGGALVYSTCTVTEEENTGVVREILRRQPELKPESLAGCLPENLSGLPGPDTIRDGYVQFLPHRHGADGFFIARLRRAK